MVGASVRRRQVEYARKRGVSCRRACAMLHVARSALQYQLSYFEEALQILAAAERRTVRNHEDARQRLAAEFMASVLNHSGSIEKISFFMEECKRMGITVLGPDINEGFAKFIGLKIGDEVKLLARLTPAPTFTIVGLTVSGHSR